MRAQKECACHGVLLLHLCLCYEENCLTAVLCLLRDRPTMEGVLWKWTNYWNGWRTRWFVLEGGVLAYYNSKDEVNQGCKGSMKVSALEINVSGVDSTRMDLVIPGEQHIYLKAASAQERQQWLVALGSAKACVNLHGSAKESGESSPDSLKAKKSELRLYCDLLVQQIHTIRTESTRTGGPDVQRLDEAAGLLGAACDTFIRTLEDCVKVANAQYQLDLPLQHPPPQQAGSHSQQAVLKNKSNKSTTHLVRSTSIDKRS